MADNATANPGAGGVTFATDDIGGVHWPFTKSAFGPRDTATEVEDSDTKRLPVKVGEELATAANLAAAPSVGKLAAGYDADAAILRYLNVRRINGVDMLIVSDPRVRVMLYEQTLLLTEIRDLLRDRRT